MPQESVLIISAVRNEARYIELVLNSMRAQTRPPEQWIVVDDGSTDGTFELLEQAAGEIPFMRVLRAPEHHLPSDADRLWHAAEARAFNFGLQFASGFTHVGKLDGDIELPPDYYERILAKFHEDPQLGIAGGVLAERSSDGWKICGDSYLEHVRGALKLYSRDCFQAIGGVREMLGWDCIDEVLARLHGYRTLSFRNVVGHHYRATGSSQGQLRGHFRLGCCMYIEGYPATWIAARSLKVAASSPRLISGVAYAAGYGHAILNRVPRFEANGYRRQLRRELRTRITGQLKLTLTT